MKRITRKQRLIREKKSHQRERRKKIKDEVIEWGFVILIIVIVVIVFYS